MLNGELLKFRKLDRITRSIGCTTGPVAYKRERERENVCVGLHTWTSYFFLPLTLKDFNGSSFLPAVLALFPLLRLYILALRSLFSLVLPTPTKPTSFAVSPFRAFTGTK